MRPGPEADGLRHKAGARERARTRDGRRLGCREGRRGNTRRSCTGMGSAGQTNTRFANATRDAHADESRTPTKGEGTDEAMRRVDAEEGVLPASAGEGCSLTRRGRGRKECLGDTGRPCASWLCRASRTCDRA